MRERAQALPRRLYTAEQVRALDRRAIEDHGIPGAELMERAGERAFAELTRRWPSAHRLLVIAAAGNNGGDGFVIARCARRAGMAVEVCFLGERARLSADAAAMYERMRAAGVEPVSFAPGVGESADVVVDAIFGTGLARAVAGVHAQAIAAINERPRAGVLAVDIPSGLHADTGAVLGTAVRADCTVTFIGLKRGLFTGAAPAHCGAVRFERLGVPEAMYEGAPVAAERIDLAGLRAALPPRSRIAHKGTYGHVLLVGGGHGFPGAVRMAAEAAGRVGAGLVSVATRPEHAALIAAQRPELMCRGVERTADLDPLAARASVVAIGPGLGTGAWGQTMLAAALALDLPAVLDADALNLLAAGAVPGTPRTDWVLTPHPAEAGRLLGVPVAEVQADRFAAARAVVERYGGICVLKGAGTVVDWARPAPGAGDPPAVCSDGNPGMASGGTGDVLTGAIAGLLAQRDITPAARGGRTAEGLAPAAPASMVRAVQLGVCVHAHAGDRAARAGERGMLAGDLIAELRAAVNPGPPAGASPG